MNQAYVNINETLSNGTLYCEQSHGAKQFDTIIEFLLVILLAFMPLVFGVVHAWSEEVVCILSGIILVSFLLKVLCYRNEEIIWSWAYIPIAIFLVIALLQLLPLPAGLVGIISPNTEALRQELLKDLPNSDSFLKSMPLSFYPYATKHDLRMAIPLAGVFVVVVNVFRQPKQIKRLLMTIAMIGGGIAVIALGQQVFGNGKIYWFIVNKNTEGYSGPFICHSHYGQFINLSIGAALGWFCVTVQEKFSDKGLKPSDILDYLGSRSARSFWVLVVLMSIGAATVFVSLTRGGMVSMLIAAAFTTLLLVSRKSLAGRGWIMAVMALVAFTCILYIGFDAVYDRFASLRSFNQYEGRLQILKDLAACFVRFPALGTGLGTHSMVYPMFQTINRTVLFTHAENEYAQVLEEMGIVGLVTLIAFGICVWSNYVRNIRRANLPIYSAAYGLGFGLLAILIHSVSDFGQHLPSNAFLSAIFCALLISLGKRRKNGGSIKKQRAAISTSGFRLGFILRPLLVVFCILGICAIWLWIFIGANNARIASAEWKKAVAIEATIAEKSWQGSEKEYADLLSQAAKALDYQPGNAKYCYWLNVWRWYSITKTNVSDTNNTLVSEESMPVAHDIVSELNKTIKACPTYGPSYSLAGQIEKFVFYDDAGAKKIRKGFQLAPCDPTVCFVAGRLDVLEGKTESSIPKFQKAVKLKSGLFKEVTKIYINHLSRPFLAVSAAGDDIRRLRYIAGVLENMQYKDLAEQALQRAQELLEIKCSESDASARDFVALAGVYRKQQENEKSIACYRRALELDYGQVSWRYSLAKLLAENDKIPQALREARICVRLRPQFKTGKRLVEKLAVNPASFVEKID